MNEHNMDPGPYLDYVHKIDFSLIQPNGLLNDALTSLSGRKIVFTNATSPYAEKILDRLGVTHHIEAIFDIVDADYVPKPEPGPYQNLVDRHGVDPANAVMVEDVMRNLVPAAEMGMTTVWVHTDRPWAHVDASLVTPDYQIENLGSWLTEVVS